MKDCVCETVRKLPDIFLENELKRRDKERDQHRQEIVRKTLSRNELMVAKKHTTHQYLKGYSGPCFVGCAACVIEEALRKL